MRKLFFIPLLAGLVLIVSILLFGGANLYYFIDIPSAMIVIVIPLIVMLSHSSLSEIINAYKMALQKKSSSISEISKSITILKALEKQIFLSGIGGTIYGIISMLTIQNINSDMIAKGFSMALLTIFYMVLLIQFFVTPFKTGLEKKKSEIFGNDT